MKLVIDGVTVADRVDGIAAALETARVRAEQAGRLIIEVQADGRPAMDLVDQHPEGDAGVAELGVVTADKGLFLRETLLDAREGMEGTRTDQRDAATAIDRGDVAAALSALRTIVEGWQGVRSIIEQSAILGGVSLSELPVGGGQEGESAEGVMRGLSPELVALRDAVTTEDWSTLSDVLGADLDARAERWSALIDALVARIGGKPG